jgi:hypothetical protein
MQQVRGVHLIDLDRHTDSRGSLVAFGSDSPIPFEPKNVYFLLDCPSRAARAEHATSNDSVIIALNGAVTVDLDNGTEQRSERLTSPDKALVIRAGVWLRLREFSPETRLVVLSSRPFGDTKYFDGPEPAVLSAAER